MKFLKEQYREFNSLVEEKRLIFAGPGTEAAPPPEAQKVSEEEAFEVKTEKLETPEDLKNVLADKKVKGQTVINSNYEALISEYNKRPDQKKDPKWLKAAEKLKNELDTAFNEGTDALLSEYTTAVEKIGTKASIEKQEKLLETEGEKLKDFLGKFRHRVAVDRMEKIIGHRIDQSKIGEKETQLKIVGEHLTAQGFGKNVPYQTQFVELIWSANNLKLAGIKTPEDLVAYLEKNINKEAIQKAVKQLTGQIPAIPESPTPEQIKFFEKQINDLKIGEDKLSGIIGTDNVNTAATHLARRIHKIGTGDEAIFIDLITNVNKPFNLTELKEKVKTYCKDIFHDLKEGPNYIQQIKNAYDKRTDLINSVSKEKGVWFDSYISSIEDAASSAKEGNLGKLFEKMENYEQVIKKFEKEEKLRKTEEARATTVENHEKDIRNPIKELVESKGLTLGARNDIKDAKEGEPDTIKIMKGNKEVGRIESKIGEKEFILTVGKFNQQFTQKGLKDFLKDLDASIDQIPDKLKKVNDESLKKVKSALDKIKSEQKKPFTLGKKTETNEKFLLEANPTYELSIQDKGKEVGVLRVDLKTKMCVMIVNPATEIAKFSIDDVGKEFDKNKAQISEVLKKIATNKAKMEGIMKVVNEKIKKLGYKMDPGTEAIDYTDDNATRELTINNAEGQLVGKITIAVNGEIQLRLPSKPDETTIATNPGDIYNKLTAENLIPELKERAPLKTGLEIAREQVVKLMIEKYPEVLQLSKFFPEIEAKIPNVENMLKEPRFKTYINYILNQLKPEEIKQLEQGKDIRLTKENLKIIQDAVRFSLGMEDLSDKDEEEIKLIKGLRLGDKSFDDVFGSDSSIAEMLSRQYEIKEEEGKIMIDGEEINDLRDLKKVLPAELYAQFDAAIKEPPNEEALKKLNEFAKGKTKALTELHEGLERMEELLKLAAEGGPEALGFFKSIAMLMQLFAAIKEAIDTGDWETFGDFVQDWNKFKNPKEVAKSLDRSKKSYVEVLKNAEPKPKLNDLLKAYLKPGRKNKEADKLFGEEGLSARYRPQAKPAIQNYLSKSLGVKIDSIGTTAGGQPKIIAYTKKDKKIEIRIGETIEGKTNVQVKKLETKWVEKPPGSGKQVEEEKSYPLYKDANGKDKSEALVISNLEDLKKFIAEGEMPTEGETPPPEATAPGTAREETETPEARAAKGTEPKKTAKGPKERPRKPTQAEHIAKYKGRPKEQFAIKQAYKGKPTIQEKIKNLINIPKPQREGKELWKFVHDEMMKVDEYRKLAENDASLRERPSSVWV